MLSYIFFIIAGRLFLIFFLSSPAYQQTPRQYYVPWLDEENDTPKWVKLPPQRRLIESRPPPVNQVQSNRHFKPETLHKITETLGAINTVGRYLVNMTRGTTDTLSRDVPSAIYTISKNVLGRNVTDTIAPLVREALPGTANEKNDDDDPRSCTTPAGVPGYELNSYLDFLTCYPNLLLIPTANNTIIASIFLNNF